MELRHDTTIEAIVEHLIATGATDLGRVFGQLFEFALPSGLSCSYSAMPPNPQRVLEPPV